MHMSGESLLVIVVVGVSDFIIGVIGAFIGS